MSGFQAVNSSKSSVRLKRIMQLLLVALLEPYGNATSFLWICDVCDLFFRRFKPPRPLLFWLLLVRKNPAIASVDLV
jgi:hypothetical protein